MSDCSLCPYNEKNFDNTHASRICIHVPFLLSAYTYLKAHLIYFVV